ncbi:hypothetical protein GX48_07948 [Paracoccidioides brasiliensis]|nr:hypothetical protein GX48_07948 [Paracoccidioides brasiliensis]
MSPATNLLCASSSILIRFLSHFESILLRALLYEYLTATSQASEGTPRSQAAALVYRITLWHSLLGYTAGDICDRAATTCPPSASTFPSIRPWSLSYLTSTRGLSDLQELAIDVGDLEVLKAHFTPYRSIPQELLPREHKSPTWRLSQHPMELRKFRERSENVLGFFLAAVNYLVQAHVMVFSSKHHNRVVVAPRQQIKIHLDLIDPSIFPG